MAILQLSKITHRKGLLENIPQLNPAELGWAIDTRQLFIGNGTLENGSPVEGNTELLTEFSDVLTLANTYTYKGENAGYVVSTGNTQEEDIARTIQDKLDERVSVQDFGAIGDGQTDDTESINRAIKELFTIEVNEEIRRALYFPAGVYKVSDTIKIPPYTKIYGDGLDSTIIHFDNDDFTNDDDKFIVEMSDNKLHNRSDIGINGGRLPTGIDISNISFNSSQKISLMLLNSITNSSFRRIGLKSGIHRDVVSKQDELRFALDQSACIKLINFHTLSSSNITFSECVLDGTNYGIDIDHEVKGFRFENGSMNYHTIGARIGNNPVNNGPEGVNISRTIFDNISHEGILVGDVKRNGSAYNIFYNVGNRFNEGPATSVINFISEDNISIGDLFDRNEEDDIIFPRIQLNSKPSIAFDGSTAIMLGKYKRFSAKEMMVTGVTNPTSIFKYTAFTNSSFKMDYTLERDGEERNGTLNVARNSTNGEISFNEEYTESSDLGAYFEVHPDGLNSDVSLVPLFKFGNPDIKLTYSVVKLSG